jgi:uncharacterized protein
MRKLVMRELIAPLLLIALTIGATVAAPAAHAAEESDYAKLNHSLVNQHIIPRYQQFMAASEKLAAAADQSCSAVPAKDLDGLKVAFVAAMQSWQGIQHVRFGPVEFFSRRIRARRSASRWTSC